MAATSEPSTSGARFPATRWTLILATRGSSATSEAALEELCRTYWRPLYAFLRKQGSSPHDAQDLVQGFLQRLLARQDFASVSPEKGRFRTFLLSSLRNFVLKQVAHTNAQKRGGGSVILPMDATEEERLSVPDPGATSPEAAYDRQWARTLLRCALARLEEEFRRRHKQDHFEVLSPFLEGAEPREYEVAARRLGMTKGAVAVAVHRMRGRLQEILRSEVHQTVTDATETEAELRELLSALAKR